MAMAAEGGAAAKPAAAAPATAAPGIDESHAKMHEKANAIRASFKRPAIWVLIFGWSLAVCAGMANSVAGLKWGVYVSHMTGATTSVGLRLEAFLGQREDHTNLSNTTITILSFVAGAFLCGLLIDKTQVHFGGKALYGSALLGNSALLVLAVVLWPSITGVWCAAAAAGLQNAMCTSHFGAVVRTTHVTGTLTDIGSITGRLVMLLIKGYCRRTGFTVLEKAEVGVDARKLGVLLPLYFSFLLGCIIGAYLFEFYGHRALLVPAGVTGSVGLLYMLLRQRLKDQIKRAERNRVREELADVENVLHRAHEYMHDLQQAQAQGRNMDTEESISQINSEVVHVLEVVHDVEASLGEWCGEVPKPHVNHAEPRAAN